MHAETTSVFMPTLRVILPQYDAAISSRSSAMSTFLTCLSDDDRRAKSRKSVVLPAPGGETINALKYPCGERRLFIMLSAQPITSCGIRTFTAVKFLTVFMRLPSNTVSPLMPILMPLLTVINPAHILSFTAYNDLSHARITISLTSSSLAINALSGESVVP